ncbi:MAG TPA: hypothetical protein VE954_06895, partial [Oligoflexus sp.]|uniref:hypothetical protein n=1 Tax=Oligoflexus sp. TaxID=1971216 RepID=UPI002D2E347C
MPTKIELAVKTIEKFQSKPFHESLGVQGPAEFTGILSGALHDRAQSSEKSRFGNMQLSKVQRKQLIFPYISYRPYSYDSTNPKMPVVLFLAAFCDSVLKDITKAAIAGKRVLKGQIM